MCKSLRVISNTVLKRRALSRNFIAYLQRTQGFIPKKLCVMLILSDIEEINADVRLKGNDRSASICNGVHWQGYAICNDRNNVFGTAIKIR